MSLDLAIDSKPSVASSLQLTSPVGVRQRFMVMQVNGIIIIEYTLSKHQTFIFD